ncbi:MAG: hypothetical protein PHE20_02410 [Patescibacteria group bacterium]|nr:hypothetical protein [Patescibacteria group bacterium]
MNNIEYSPNIKVGDKIKIDERNYNRPRRRLESFLPLMKQKLALQVEKYNQYYPYTWLKEDGSISMIEHPEWEQDEALCDDKENAWARESGKSLEQWRLDKEKNPSNLTEIALTLVLQKLLPPNLMVLRSARYDDYENGVDQLIVDRNTGLVVCGIDEVINIEGNTGKSKKEKKVTNKMLQGGAQVKYGARVENGALLLGKLKNIPAFYLSLDKNELADLCESLEQEEATVSERTLLSRLRTSLSEQIKLYEPLPLSPSLKLNLNAFQESLKSWLK